MTDDQIRAWLEDYRLATDRLGWTNLEKQHLADCLTELLAHREMHRSIKYAVWMRDQSSESGWRMLAAFPDRDAAETYRNVERNGALMLRGLKMEYLVLPFQERPCLTAR